MTSRKLEVELELVKEILKKREMVVLFPRGSSMKPFLNHKEMVIVKQVPQEDIKEGDIVLFQPEESKIFVLHRVLRKYKEREEISFLIKGDYDINIDGVIKKEKILGKVITMKKGKYKIDFKDKKMQRINYIIALCSLFTFWIYECLNKIKICIIKRMCFILFYWFYRIVVLTILKSIVLLSTVMIEDKSLNKIEKGNESIIN